jgi:hypothetical protein
LLSQALQQQLQHTTAGSIASTNSSSAISPFYTHSACFAGCVQLIANVFVLGDPAGSDCSSGSDSEDSGSSSSNINLKTTSDDASARLHPTLQDQRADVAAGLLARVSSIFNSAAAHFADSVGAAEACGLDDRAVGFRATEGAEVVPQHIDVMVGGAAASTSSSTAAGSTSMQLPGSSSSSSVGAKPAAAAAATAAATAASLLHCQPCCLVANESQQLRLTVNITLASADSNSSSSSGIVQVPCRLLAVQQGQVLVDENVTVILQPGQGSNKASINIALPGLVAGLMHVALLPGSKPPTAEAAFCSAHIHDSCSSSDDEQPTAAAAAAPTTAGLLLLQPLLVPPAAAAAELQAFGQEAANEAAAACIDTPARCAGSNCDDIAAAADWEVVSALTVDVAYLLSAADEIATTSKLAAAAAAVGEQSVNNASGLLPAGVAAVLSHMAQHLAAWQCWQLMHFLVETMHTAAAPERAAAAASEQAAAAAEEPAAGDTENENMPAEKAPAVAGTSSSSSSVAEQATGIITNEVTSAPAAAVEYEPGTKPNNSASASSSSSSSSTNVSPSDRSSSSSLGTTKQLPAADNAATHDELVAAAVDEASLLSCSSKLASSLSQLMFGFRSNPLELSYLDYITMQTYAVDAFEAIFALAVGLSANILTDELQVHFAAAGSAAAAGFAWWSSAAFWLAAWEIASRATNFASLVVPNFVLLLNRHRLGRGGR